MTSVTLDDDKSKSLRNVAFLVYILYIASYFVGITSLIGVIIAHVKKNDAAGTLYESHLCNQRQIFWWGLLVGILGALLTFVFVGWFVLLGVFVWSLYRVIKGILRLNDGRPM